MHFVCDYFLCVIVTVDRRNDIVLSISNDAETHWRGIVYANVFFV